MYPVSDEYIAAMRSPVQRHRMTGTIGGRHFTDANILAGSFSITNQCSSNDTVEIGQVYTGELSATFRGLPEIRNSMKGMKVIPVFGLRLPSGIYESVPLGEFNIEEANWTASGVVVKAYDNMSLLDKHCNFDQTQGTPFALASAACELCGLVLGTTEEEFAAFANGDQSLSMYTENDIETWRDFLSWLAQTCACNVFAGRDGKIYFRAYGQEVVDNPGTERRFQNASFSDFETRYSGISCVNIAEKTTSYYGTETDDALTMNLGSNPFLQYGLAETKEQMRRAILDALQSVRYVPFQCSMIGNPAYDLMDVFAFHGGIADDGKLSCMTKFTFNYHGQYTMTGVGKNPALATAKSKTDKEIAGIYGSQDSSSMKYYIFENMDQIRLADGASKSVMLMRYASSKDTHVTIDMEILVKITLTEQKAEEESQVEPMCVTTVTYYSDGTEIRSRHPVETWRGGYHVLDLIYDLDVHDEKVHTWDVWLKLEGGSAEIAPYAVHGRISGSGLVEELPWDGHIYAEDILGNYSFLPYFKPFTEEAAAPAFIPKRDHGAGDTVGHIDFMSYFFGLSDEGMVSDVVLSPTSHHDDLLIEATVTQTAFTNGTVITPLISNARKVTAVASPETKFYISHDDGETWGAYIDGEWVSGGHMDVDEFSAVSASGWAGTARVKVVMGAHDTLSEIIIYGGTLL